MGIDKLSTVYGRIIISGELDKAKETINNLDLGSAYPYIQKEMFNTGWEKEPWHYESQIIGFSANYKRIEDHWNSFIIKIEYLIEELNYFESALFNLETFYFGTYNFKWTKIDNFVIGRNGKKRNEWNLSIGHEGNYKNFEERLLKNEIYDIGIRYPIVFDESLYGPVKKMINELPETSIGKQIPLKDYLDESIRTHDHLYRIWTYLELYKGVKYGYDSQIGRWIKVENKIEL